MDILFFLTYPIQYKTWYLSLSAFGTGDVASGLTNMYMHPGLSPGKLESLDSYETGKVVCVKLLLSRSSTLRHPGILEMASFMYNLTLIGQCDVDQLQWVMVLCKGRVSITVTCMISLSSRLYTVDPGLP